MQTTDRIIKVGELTTGVWKHRYHQIRSVYSPEGIAPTITAGGGGGTETKIIEKEKRMKRAAELVTPKHPDKLTDKH